MVAPSRTPDETRAPSPPPEQLGKYALLERIGVGGMAEVWLARASGPGGFAKSCVVKMVRPGVDQARFSRMFMDEARLAALLNHPNIVQLFDFGEHEGRLFIAMEFVQGRTLRALIKKCETKGMRVPLDHAARIMLNVLDGLHHAHTLADEHGDPLRVIHRDVSPENIMITYSGVPKLLDFGIAKATLSTDRTRDGRAKGKLTYMAPEQLMGAPLDHRVDLYAAGTLLYETCCGRHPFPFPSAEQLARAILDDPVTPPQKLDPSLPDDLCDIIMKALEKDPANRFGSAADMRDALDGFLQTLTVNTAFPRLDQLLGAVWQEEMAEDASRTRKATGSSTQQSLPPRGIPALVPVGSDADVEDATVRDPQASRAMAAAAQALSHSHPRAQPATRSEFGISATSQPDFPPPPPLPTGEQLLSTDDRHRLDQVFSEAGGLAPRHLEPTGPLDDEVITARRFREDSTATPMPPPRDGAGRAAPPSFTGPILSGNMWHVPRRVGISGLVSAAMASGAVFGATFWVLGLRQGQGQVPLPMPPSAGVLHVLGRAGCALELDGLSLARSPVGSVEVPPGDHSLVARCPGSPAQEFPVRGDRDTVVVLSDPPRGADRPRDPAPAAPANDPAADEGYIVVMARKPASVFVDGRRVGDVPDKPLAVPPGSHVVRVVTRDKKDRTVTVEVARGRTATARFP
ncbi:MAG: serine/threonine protein kinase [Deltaproteobacteria bacterium]|nr:serine/threonine protein kinase [Deltaproteobacteria bacterium]